MTNSNVVDLHPNAEPAAEVKEFYVFADGAGVSEIRFSNDLGFVLANFIGVADFIAQSMQPAITTQQFLSDLIGMLDMQAMAETVDALVVPASEVVPAGEVEQ